MTGRYNPHWCNKATAFFVCCWQKAVHDVKAARWLVAACQKTSIIIVKAVEFFLDITTRAIGVERSFLLCAPGSTPLPWCGLSLSTLLMGRQPRSTLPHTNSHLTPDWSHLISFPENDVKFKEKQKQNYDSRHRVDFQNTLPCRKNNCLD